jgi:RND family efflux transporter MFP subunit
MKLFPSSLAIVALTLVLLLLVGCEADDVSAPPYYHQVIAEPLVLNDSYAIKRYFVGQIKSRQRAELGFELAGTVVEVSVNEGDVVEAGQVLARLDARLLNAEIEDIKAQGEDVLARLELAQLKLKRQRELINEGYSAKQQIDELKAEISSFNAQLKRQQAQLESAFTRLEKHTLKAPYRGEIASRNIEEGGVSMAGQAVFKLLEQGREEARVGVPSKLISTLSVGSPVSVIVADKTLTASVITIASNIDDVTRTAAIRLALPEDQSIVNGELLYLQLSEQIVDAGYWVSDMALSSGVRGMWNLYVLVPELKAKDSGGAEQALFTIEARSIELLYMDGAKAFVKGALSPGELVMSAGLHRVVPGLSVKLSSGNQFEINSESQQ